MSNEELVAQIQSGKNVNDNMLQLWQQNKGIIGIHAYRRNSVADMEDLKQEAFIALYQAVKNYDASKGMSFISYADFAIKNYMEDCVCNNMPVHIGRHRRSRVWQYKKLVNRFNMHMNRKPTDGEICDLLQITQAELETIKKAMLTENVKSMDTPLEDEEGYTVADTIPLEYNFETDVLDNVQKEQLKEELWSVVDELEDKNAYILRGIFLDNKPCHAIGKEIGISAMSVLRHKKKAIKQLRSSQYSERLLPYVEDYIDTRAYKSGVNTFKRTWTSSTEYTALGLIERGY